MPYYQAPSIVPSFRPSPWSSYGGSWGPGSSWGANPMTGGGTDPSLSAYLLPYIQRLLQQYRPMSTSIPTPTPGATGGTLTLSPSEAGYFNQVFQQDASLTPQQKAALQSYLMTGQPVSLNPSQVATFRSYFASRGASPQQLAQLDARISGTAPTPAPAGPAPTPATPAPAAPGQGSVQWRYGEAPPAGIPDWLRQRVEASASWKPGAVLRVPNLSVAQNIEPGPYSMAGYGNNPMAFLGYSATGSSGGLVPNSILPPHVEAGSPLIGTRYGGAWEKRGMGRTLQAGQRLPNSILPSIDTNTSQTYWNGPMPNVGESTAGFRSPYITERPGPGAVLRTDYPPYSLVAA